MMTAGSAIALATSRTSIWAWEFTSGRRDGPASDGYRLFAPPAHSDSRDPHADDAEQRERLRHRNRRRHELQAVPGDGKGLDLIFVVDFAERNLAANAIQKGGPLRGKHDRQLRHFERTARGAQQSRAVLMVANNQAIVVYAGQIVGQVDGATDQRSLVPDIGRRNSQRACVGNRPDLITLGVGTGRLPEKRIRRQVFTEPLAQKGLKITFGGLRAPGRR